MLEKLEEKSNQLIMNIFILTLNRYVERSYILLPKINGSNIVSAIFYSLGGLIGYFLYQKGSFKFILYDKNLIS